MILKEKAFCCLKNMFVLTCQNDCGIIRNDLLWGRKFYGNKEEEK